MSAIATVDISRWYAGGADADAVAAEVDEGLQRAGFIVVTGHGVDPDLAARVRAASREFFALPDEVKQRYSVPVGGHGWIGPGAEANAYAEGTETPPDLKESYSLGAETATGLAYNITGSALKTALEALANVDTGSVTVTGTGGTYEVTVPGTFTANGAGITGGTVTVTPA